MDIESKAINFYKEKLVKKRSNDTYMPDRKQEICDRVDQE